MGQWFVSLISEHIVKKRRRLAVVALLFAGVAIALAAGSASKYMHDAQAKTAPAAAAGVPVTVSHLEPQTVNAFAEFSGRINAVDYAEIRPQVSGRITEIRFHDGQHVNAGDVLLVIDPRPYQAAVDKAQADIATATANVQYTKAERERGSQLIKNNTLSLETFDQRVNAEAAAQASLQSA